ncbi:hypothetical protein [Ornithinibacillus californiensis]|uniref:hypothetical protein n=1 Tax=Ornithinibacillus californiensis TaxID=161536 RepID=UPI00064D8A6A|nr:hypothetical protein [Ornithinibacillus californiensis]
MDKQLKDLRNEYDQIPTSFSEKDKQVIRSKISELSNKPERKKFHLYPQLLTGVVLAMAFVIFLISTNQQPGMFMSGSDDASDSKEMSMDQEVAEAEMESFNTGINNNSVMEDSASEESMASNIFHPDNVQYDINFPVSDVQQDGEQMIITFVGYHLSGSFANDKSLRFEPNEDSWQQIPIAEGDSKEDIPIYISNGAFARKVYDIDRTVGTELSIFVEELEYHYSPEGSSIYIKVADESGMTGIDLNIYNESITLSNELLNIYEEYKASKDDTVLKGLTAFDVFKLYHYADYQGDLEVQHALYFNKENHYVPDKETFLAEANHSEAQATEFYNQMLELNRFEELYRTEDEVIIRYILDYEIGFRLYRDKELDVWKVSWMPIQ